MSFEIVIVDAPAAVQDPAGFTNSDSCRKGSLDNFIKALNPRPTTGYIGGWYTNTLKGKRDVGKPYANRQVYPRPNGLLKNAEVADVYVDMFQNQFKKNGEWRIPQETTHIVGLQPDHPDRTNSLDDMIEYFIDNTYDDLVTVDRLGTRNGSVRIVKAEYVKWGTMSRRVGSMLDDCTNIHSEDDLNQAEKNILSGRTYNG